MNGQIVLCKGVNDGKELDYSIRKLMEYLPVIESVSVVPVGLSRFREGLYPLEPFTKEDAKEVIDMIHGYQQQCMEKCGTHFIHASDEWFILAGQEFPDEAYYEGYGQLENGVGMMRLLLEEVKERLEELSGDDREKTVSIATAKLAFPTIEKLARDVEKKFPHIKVHVYCIKNEFFGEHITVSGLLTGGDIIAQLKDKELGEELLLPCNVLKADEDIFLDDISLKGLSDSLQVPVNIIQSEGRDFVDKIIAIENGGNYE